MIKRCFIDTETTGLDPKLNAVIEIGGIIEIDGEVRDTFSIHAQPLPEDMIVPKALEVNKTSFNTLMAYPLPHKAYQDFCLLLSKYVNKFNKKDKFLFYGWNCRFDYDFLWQFFLKQEDKYFGSYFSWPTIDVACLVAEYLGERRGEIKDFHLDTVATYFGLKVDETKRHTALGDAELTRGVYYYIKKGVKDA